MARKKAKREERPEAGITREEARHLAASAHRHVGEIHPGCVRGLTRWAERSVLGHARSIDHAG